jgi:hypothetical protein
MVYGRRYGDVHRIKARLEALGYEEGSFVGAKIAAIDHPDEGWLMPYIDRYSGDEYGPSVGAYDVDYNSRGNYFTIVDSGDYTANQHEEGRVGFSEDEDEDDYFAICTYSGNYIYSEYDATYLRDTGNYVHDDYRDNYYECDATGNYYQRLSSMTSMEGGEYYWSRDYFADYGGTCAIDGWNYPSSQLVELADGRFVHNSHAIQNEDGDYVLKEPELNLEQAA